MKDKKAIKRDILNKFRSLNSVSEDLLPAHWLELVYVKNLTADEKKTFKRAVQELIAVGIVESVEGTGLNLRLTRKGENLLYSGENQKPGGESGQDGGLFHFTGSEA
ncbi:MAG: hypothetical protein MUC46_09040 [Desulfobacterales bacterium]|jgi:predicted transcriptional regulator|nr:hypothetical protein [Desulfobacterales bacterium]